MCPEGGQIRDTLDRPAPGRRQQSPGNALRNGADHGLAWPLVPDFQAPRGMADVLAPQSERWARLLAIFAGLAERAGFGLVITPLIEHLEVFQRVGESTDIVRKEMYDFEDKGGRRVAVRPEITAGLMRAFAEHHPAVPWKAWTAGPNFRYEAPQAARYRQHFQVDAEIVGTDDPDADVEVIALLDGFHRALGLTQRRLVVNSLGDDASRAAYLAALTAYLQGNAADLSEQSRETLALNPLRVLDSRRPEDQPVVAAAPQVLEYLTPDAEARFDRVQEGLKVLGIAYEIEPRLVRGLDYYNHTLFEFPSHALDSAQNAIGGGGRYNGLVEALGGPAGTGGVGFGAGIERILLACDAEGVFAAPTARVQVYVVDTTRWPGGAGPGRRAAVGRHRRRPVVRPAEHEEPDEGRRPLGCGDRGDRRTGRAGRRRRDAARPAGRRPAGRSATGGGAPHGARRRGPGVVAVMSTGRPTSMRTDQCGTLRASDAGRTVSLCGWVARRREHGEHLAFLDLRDHTGLVQCVVNQAVDVRSEYVLRITGTVRLRPEGTVNPNLPTGEVEVGDCEVEVLSTAEPPPFPIDSRADEVDETVRLRHRYLDLRRERMQRNLRVRSAVNSAIRAAMERQGFVEIETPMLVPSTPEGAREFLVPSRQSPGSFYALPQSPQLFKQLLMVAGVDRYFQIARCLRDEDLRADRQYEFMQLDAEMSFVDQDDVLEAISEAVLDAAEAVTGERPLPIPHITWHEAMDRYGVDKPDLRFGMELVELTKLFAATEFKAFAGAESIKGIRVPAMAEELGRSRLDALTARAKQLGAKGLVWMKVAEEGSLEGPVTKFLSESEQAGLSSALAAEPGDVLLIVADEWATTCEVLGQLRNDLGRPPVHEGPYRYVWVVDFPLFVGIDEATGRPKPGHHPFTRVHPDDLDRLEAEPLSVRSRAYDLVLNGWELGSGSIRIHEPELQRRIFNLLGVSDEEADRRFGFFLNPFRFGAPPHGGFAFGIDRLVAILAGEDNIREVIAFPKPQSGMDPMTGAPTPVAPAQLAELGLRTLPPSS